VGARVLAAVLGVASAAPARAGGPDSYLAHLASSVAERLDALAAARAPKLVPPVPPVPVPVRWKPVKLGSFDLGAPLAALAAADLDGDGKFELYAVTARDVVGIAIRANKAIELGRVAFSGPRAAAEPRDVVGTALGVGRELVAASSGWTNELRVAWQGKQLVGQPGGPGFLVCPQERASLVTGRNYFGPAASGPAASGPAASGFYGVRCRDDLVDPDGHPLRIRAQLALTGKLGVTIEKCAAGGQPCRQDAAFELDGVGAAFEIADVNRDGTPEVVVSDAAAPGDPDFVKVVSAAAPQGRPLFKKPFQAGVAGIAAVDSDGDGVDEVIAAVRLAGATRVDLWRLH
jgi:hypothetical protein